MQRWSTTGSSLHSASQIFKNAIGPRGGIFPIISPKTDFLDGINAQNAALLSQPIIVPAGNPRESYNQGYKDAKDDAKYEAYLAEIKTIKSSITDTNLLCADVLHDLGIKPGGNIVARDLLGYLRLWVRTHPECTTNSVAPAPQKK